jgi:hypothetical protein
VIPYWHQLYRPFGAINLRPGDMAPFVAMLLDRGRHQGRALFSAEEIARSETPTTTLAARAGLAFGYGLGNYAAASQGVVWHGHGGDADGYLAHFAYSPELGRGYFLVINAFQNTTLKRLRGIVENVLARDRKSPAPLPSQQGPGDASACSGRYERSAARFGPPRGSVSLVSADDGLVLIRDDRRELLLPVSDGLYRRPWEPVATTALLRAGSVIYLQGPFGDFERPDDESTGSCASGIKTQKGPERDAPGPVRSARLRWPDHAAESPTAR